MPFQPRVLQLHTAEQVRRQLEAIAVDPCGVNLMTDKALHINLLLEKVSCVAANILKQEMLALGGDAAVARGTVACSIDHTDVVLMGTRKQLAQLVVRLPRQPFGLKALAAELDTVLTATGAVKILAGCRCRLDISRPQVMGIINVTPDSFYDGGVCLNLDAVLRQAEKQVEDGADLLDVGGESTRPGAALVTMDVELERVVPVVEALKQRFDLPISVDTNKAGVAEAVLESGADFINDISGLTFDAEMATVVSQKKAGVFVMHTRGCPQTMQKDTSYHDLLTEVIGSLRHSIDLARQAGVPAESISVDPGIGFGKSVSGNLELLRRLDEVAALGYPVLIGASRKSFIGAVLDQPVPQQRLYGSLASVAVAAQNGAHLFRVHDVAATRQTVDLAWAINHETHMA
ncbi:dihydropteroate synthase [Desulfuromonas acetoxidans]|uniref:Dihydropteroate synthase n=1 Tax=Desulfuromonas acetoxidans (strain DSM 684 / 11070) TaxID=281689 RepID=Q1JY22_DESA6|nr:dihydropteroate synthase [Desulfuromonas acetoxidans]EAT15174.1 dihydropteroate synthase [Desulfuromonas acetoxidans DSM 684]MBF0644001.1 dihydropteroate synthase [Desulfuromonas acetoxidans]NVD23239.1 dihydropteroate synthase [Desulfuromonas acetoxidans]NVE15520.1 dihydropteroate synthase [Desulfuromonas acetoxidans]